MNKYMELAIKLAEKGRGKVEPNPVVGAVIIKNGKIIGKGYHKKFGENHAEINAIKNAGSIDSEKIRTALLSTIDFQGVTGKISYENGSRIPNKGVTIVEVKDSKFNFITSIVPQNVPLP